jgi:hypothetical protein
MVQKNNVQRYQNYRLDENPDCGDDGRGGSHTSTSPDLGTWSPPLPINALNMPTFGGQI